MSACYEIVIAELVNVFYVHLSYIQEEPNGFIINILRESQKRNVSVQLGPRNANQIVVYGDLSKSDLLIEPDQREQTL